MKNIYDYEKAKNKKNNEVFLFNLGHEYLSIINAEADAILESHGDLPFPDELDAWFSSYQKENEKQDKQDRLWQVMRRKSFKVAMGIFLFLSINSVMMVRVEGYRLSIFNFILQAQERFSVIKTDEASQVFDPSILDETWTGYYYPTFIPEGFTVDISLSEDRVKYIKFKNTEGEIISLNEHFLNGEERVDTEEGTKVDVDINGETGIYIQKEGVNILTWTIEDKVISLSGNINRDILIKIARGLIKK